MRGALAPVITPFRSDLSIDPGRLERHCRWLLANRCGLALFGTNSEGNSLSVDEKAAALDRLIEAGLPAARMMPGTGHCALPDTIRLTRHAVGLGCGGVLMLPPFYYKGVSDDGLYEAVARVIDGAGDARLRIYLYHIPPVAQVGFSIELIARLLKAFPGIVAGIKDSSGDFSHTRRLLQEFPGWGVFCGNELDLVEAMGLGAVGCISATCNVNAGEIAFLAEEWQSSKAENRQKAANAVRGAIAKFPMIPALKALAGRFHDDAGWRTVRPPLTPLGAAERDALFAATAGLDFSMRQPAAALAAAEAV
jgi:4-hydroxy-tetrahydrodipicolinate synthase